MVKLFEAFGEALGIHLSSYKGSVGMIVVEVDRSFLLALLWGFASELLVEEVCRDVVDVDKVNTCLTNHLAIPSTVGVVTPLNLSGGPLIAWREGEKDRGGTLLPNIINELTEIPSKGVDHFIAPICFHLVYMTGIRCTGNDPTLFLVGNRTDIVMTELDQYEVSWL